MSQHHVNSSTSDHTDGSTKESGQILTSFQQKLLIKSLQTDLPPEYQQRINIMLLADQGYSQSQICEMLGCCHETARYWIAIAQAGNAHQWNEHKLGRPKLVNEHYLNRLKELVKHSPRDYGYPFQRWTAHWLSKHLAEETGTQVSNRHINRLLKEMGLSTRSRLQSAKTPTPSIAIEQPAPSNILIRDLQETTPPSFPLLTHPGQINF